MSTEHTTDQATEVEETEETTQTDRLGDLARAATAKLSADRISRLQVASYLAFFEDTTFFEDALGAFDQEALHALARDGKRAANGKELDADYVEAWEQWRPSSVPKSHMWIKGMVATALAVAEEAPSVESTHTTTAAHGTPLA